MADGVQFQLVGIEELNAKLKTVTNDMQYKGGRFALRKAAQVVREAAKAGANRVNDPETQESIAANIVERWSTRTFKATGDLKFRVGVMGGAGGSTRSSNLAGLPGGDTRHWRHVEFGTEKVPARPFMRPALENNMNQVLNEFIVQYTKKLDRLIKSAAR